ncbi:hypothetical protein NQZ68_036567 [Dissostichus eleginoides]|nr:hypothetical protein NQZ68_036567 [Dissostichus eleginoides]
MYNTSQSTESPLCQLILSDISYKLESDEKSGATSGTAEPSRQEEREGSEEECPDRPSTAPAGSMQIQTLLLI